MVTKTNIPGQEIATLPRTARLKDATHELSIETGYKYGTRTKACIERARYWTESFKETEGEPMVLRRAKALANYLDKRTIFIMEDELLVGHIGKDPHSLPFYPEQQSPERIKTEIVAPHMLTPDEWEELDEILNYWKGKTLEEACLATFPDVVKKHVYPPTDWKQFKSDMYQNAVASPTPDLPRVFSLGFKGIIREIKARLARLDPLRIPSNTELKEIIGKRDALNAMLIATKSVIEYIGRYGKLAKETAEKTEDPVRKAELEQIAENCARISTEPVATFWQALQLVWFIHTIDHASEAPGGGITQRYDQVLLPYYRKDIEAGRLTREKAQELLEDLWLKHERAFGVLFPTERRQWSESSSTYQNIALGGVDEAGNDATNELTFLILDVQKSVRTVQPTLSFRYHDKTPDDILAKAWEVVMTGLGMPAFYNDKVAMPYLLGRGISIKDARDYVVVGCVSPVIPGKNIWSKELTGTWLLLAKCLELALNNGVDMLDGKQIGPKTGDPRKFKNFEEVVEAFRAQVEYSLRINTCAHNIYRLKQAELLHRPFTSALHASCIERGEDATNFEENSLSVAVNTSGGIDVADSLVAIKKLIFDEKKLTWDELLKALRANFEGYEDTRELCLNIPKFGSDDDYVDEITRDVFCLVDLEFAKRTDIRGATYTGVYQSISVYVTAGERTAALPCGRRARQPLADGGISPEIGFGREITKVLKSASKLDHDTPSGMLLNQRLIPGTTARQFVNLIRAWGDLGCYQIQFNVFDTKVMKDAQVHPEKYPDLIVRVAGYSAHFVNLSRNTQDAIIARSEQTCPV